MNSKLVAKLNQHRPRLRVVLPLLLVCIVAIFFSIQDRFRERSAHREGNQNYSATESLTATEAGFRRIPRRGVTSAPPFSRYDRLPGDNTLAEDLPSDTDGAEAGIRSSGPLRNTAGTAPIAAIIAPPTRGGIITGHVTLNGVPPPERDIPLDPSCARLRAEKITTRFFVVDERGGLGDVVVALAPAPNGLPLTSPIPLQPELLDQIGCEFVPYVLALRVGQKLRVRNSDPLFHNVHVIPNGPGTMEFNRAHPAGSPEFELMFEAPELFLRIKCDVHIWMFAYVAIFDHAYFDVTQPNGLFRLTNVPSGDFMLVAAHRRLPKVMKPITVRHGETNTIDFVLEIANMLSP